MLDRALQQGDVGYRFQKSDHSCSLPVSSARCAAAIRSLEQDRTISNRPRGANVRSREADCPLAESGRRQTAVKQEPHQLYFPLSTAISSKSFWRAPRRAVRALRPIHGTPHRCPCWAASITGVARFCPAPRWAPPRPEGSGFCRLCRKSRPSSASALIVPLDRLMELEFARNRDPSTKNELRIRRPSPSTTDRARSCNGKQSPAKNLGGRMPIWAYDSSMPRARSHPTYSTPSPSRRRQIVELLARAVPWLLEQLGGNAGASAAGRLETPGRAAKSAWSR